MFLCVSPCFQGVVTNFEIFRMREKQVPVDVVEMKGKSTQIVFVILPPLKKKSSKEPWLGKVWNICFSLDNLIN